MDTIKVNSDSLNRAKKSFSEFRSSISEAISLCESYLKQQFDGIDENTKRELSEFIEQLGSLKGDIKQFWEDNSAAISDRIAKVEDYSNTSYKSRNIF